MVDLLSWILIKILKNLCMHHGCWIRSQAQSWMFICCLGFVRCTKEAALTRNIGAGMTSLSVKMHGTLSVFHSFAAQGLDWNLELDLSARITNKLTNASA